jgi:gas vesicle protein GvpO
MAEHDDSDLKTGAKAAAAAAAVGAAVGVARAIAARAEDASRNGHEEAHDEDDQELEPIAVHDDEPEEEGEEEHDEEHDDAPVQATGVEQLRGLTTRARTLLQELSGADVESVSAIARTRDGWSITLEAVELRRIPDSMDVMATYNVEVDGDGDLLRYERRRRYARSQSDHGVEA